MSNEPTDTQAHTASETAAIRLRRLAGEPAAEAEPLPLADAKCHGWERVRGDDGTHVTVWLMELPHFVANNRDECNEEFAEACAVLRKHEEESP